MVIEVSHVGREAACVTCSDVTWTLRVDVTYIQ